MRFYKQLNVHKPAEGKYGDCFRTVIGCLLDMPPEAVPHWFDGLQDDDGGERQWTACREWLAERKLALVMFAVLVGENVLAENVMKHLCEWNKGVSLMLFGRSQTANDHVVIIRDGKILHDPSFLESGIVGPASNGVYTVATLAPLILTTVDEEFQG